MNCDFSVRLATSVGERNAIYRLRYDLYVSRQNLFEDVADHDRRFLVDDGDATSRLFYAAVDGEVVGTIRINWGAEHEFSKEMRETFALEHFQSVVPLEDMLVFSRFVVSPEHRGGLVPYQLMLACAEFSVTQGAELAFCDCEPHLVGLYQRLGFRPYRPLYDHPTSGLLVPLLMIGADLGYLARIGSPLRQTLARRTKPVDVAERILAILPERGPVRGAEFEGEGKYWSEILGWLDHRDDAGQAFFDRLDREEIRQLLSKSHILDCRRGDALIRRGHVSRTLYILLEGSLEVREQGKCVGVSHAGDVIGEVAFLLGDRRMGVTKKAVASARPASPTPSSDRS